MECPRLLTNLPNTPDRLWLRNLRTPNARTHSDVRVRRVCLCDPCSDGPVLPARRDDAAHLLDRSLYHGLGVAQLGGFLPKHRKRVAPVREWLGGRWARALTGSQPPNIDPEGSSEFHHNVKRNVGPPAAQDVGQLAAADPGLSLDRELGLSARTNSLL